MSRVISSAFLLVIVLAASEASAAGCTQVLARRLLPCHGEWLLCGWRQVLRVRAAIRHQWLWRAVAGLSGDGRALPDGRVAVRGRVAFAVSLLLALAPIASAGSVKIRATRIDKGTLPESLEIVAQSAGTSKAEVLRGSSGTMVLPDGAWVLQARAAGFWSEAIEVAVTSERLQDVAIRVLPTRTVAGLGDFA
jgi:hypothetical protein